MKYEAKLSSSTPTAQVTLPFSPDSVTVMNNTPHALFIRRGTASLPTRDSYDYLIPAGIYTTLPVVGREFGFALDLDASETPYFRMPAQIIFTQNEPPPIFSSAVYRESASRLETVPPSQAQDFIISTRGARGLYIELSRLSTPLQPEEGVNALVCEVLTGQVGNTRISGVLNSSWGSDVTRRTVAVADDIVQLRVINMTAQPVNYALKWTLLDQYAPLTEKYATIAPSRGFTLAPDEQANMYNTTTQLSGIVRAMSVAISRETPDEDFAVWFSPASGLVSSTGVKTIALSNTVRIAQSFPEHWVFGRASGYFVDMTEHAIAPRPYATRYIVPLEIYVPRLFDLNVFNDGKISTGTLDIRVQLHIDLEIAG